jgi:hypothetical protein
MDLERDLRRLLIVARPEETRVTLRDWLLREAEPDAGLERLLLERLLDDLLAQFAALADLGVLLHTCGPDSVYVLHERDPPSIETRQSVDAPLLLEDDAYVRKLREMTESHRVCDYARHLYFTAMLGLLAVRLYEVEADAPRLLALRDAVRRRVGRYGALGSWTLPYELRDAVRERSSLSAVEAALDAPARLPAYFKLLRDERAPRGHDRLYYFCRAFFHTRDDLEGALKAAPDATVAADRTHKRGVYRAELLETVCPLEDSDVNRDALLVRLGRDEDIKQWRAHAKNFGRKIRTGAERTRHATAARQRRARAAPEAAPSAEA